MDIRHDRAVFHFLTTREDRGRYRHHLLQTLKRGGSAIIATFALDGLEMCSGRPVASYSPEQLADEFGPTFELRNARLHVHTTPWDSTQSLQYASGSSVLRDALDVELHAISNCGRSCCARCQE